MPDDTEARAADHSETEAPAEAAPGSPPPASDDDGLIWDPRSKTWLAPAELPAEPVSPPRTRRAGRLPVDDGPYEPAGGPVGPAIVLSGILGAVLAVTALLFFPGPADPRRGAAPSTPAASQRPASDPVSLSEAVRPSVVGIRANGTGRTGSGIVIDPAGVIATAASVIEGAQGEVITFHNGATSPARVRGVDAVTGLAILSAETNPVPAVVRGSTEFLRTGEAVAVIATPADTHWIVDVGLVLSPGRPVRTGGTTRYDLVRLGASPGLEPGGAVVGVSGDVVGLSTSISDGPGSGTFLPIEVVFATATQMLDETDGAIRHPWVGVGTAPASDDPRLPGRSEALIVTDIAEGSPGEAAEIQRGDLIVEVDGEPVEGSMTLFVRALRAGVGEELKVKVLRGENPIDLTLTVAEAPRAAAGGEVA